ncbi:MAG: hypothetical protein ABIL58_09185 [Pseudomonadota bacterium]
MPFIIMPGITGKVFVPEGCLITAKKHPCADCFACQQCADERCAICRCDRGKCTAPPNKDKS